MYNTKIYIFACVYTIFSRFIQNKTELYTFVYKAREANENGEWRARFLGERRWKILANIYYGAQLNKTLAITLNLGY